MKASMAVLEDKDPWTRDHGPTGDIGTIGPCCNAGDGAHGLGELVNSVDLGPAAEAGSEKRLTAKTGPGRPGAMTQGPSKLNLRRPNIEATDSNFQGFGSPKTVDLVPVSSILGPS